MASQLNIKDQRTIDLARSLAARSGKSVTETIRDALEAKDRAEVSGQDARLARMKAMAEEASARLTPEQRAMPLKEVMDSIYGPDGLPEK